MDLQKKLKDFTPTHEYFIGIDSDGCVFDTMEVKQKEFFIPIALDHFDLSSVKKEVRETWEFVNLYSINRGGNRFISFIKVFDLLSQNESVRRSGAKLPELDALKTWTRIETKLGNESLQEYLKRHPDQHLENILRWSKHVNTEIERRLKKIPPFPFAKKTLEIISSFADIVIISQTPIGAIEREWRENDIAKHVKLIAGQEHGTKTDQLEMASIGKYPNDKILMIGDAKGDLDAAKNNGVQFFPILPGKEDLSWKLFLEEGFEKFRTGKYKGSFEYKLINDFLRSLPDKQ